MLSLSDYESAVQDFWFAHNNLYRLMEVFVVDEDDDGPQVVEDEFYESYVDDQGLITLYSLMRLVADHYETPSCIFDFLEQYEMVLDAEPIPQDEGHFSEEEEEDDEVWEDDV